ncbi:MAG TPA: hypothetical protein VMU47_06780 [Caldimonas sp.]|nr:hypothetical protein [Caldimonas sp.]
MASAAVTAFLEQPLVTILAGSFIRSGAGGDPAKQAARAAELAAIVTAAQKYNAGGGAAALADLNTALATKITDPAEALAISQSLAILGGLPAVVAQGLNSTLLGQAATAALNNVGNAVLAVCALYPTPTATAGATPAVVQPGGD